MNGTRIKEIAGGALAAVVIGGIFGAQCVLPFFRDNSSDFNCESTEANGTCDQSGTVGHFLAAMCGRSAVAFRGDLTTTINSDPTAREPETQSLDFKCGPRTYIRVEAEQGDNVNASNFRDHVTKGRGVFDLYVQWNAGTVSTEVAKTALLSR